MVLGSVLIVAGSLKIVSLVSANATESATLDSHWYSTPGFQLAAANIEILIGLAAIIFASAPAIVPLLLMVFTGFAVLSLKAGLAGAPSCGCVGEVAVNPWYMFGLDVAAVGLLVVAMIGRQIRSNRKLRKGRIAFAVIFVAVACVLAYDLKQASESVTPFSVAIQAQIDGDRGWLPAWTLEGNVRTELSLSKTLSHFAGGRALVQFGSPVVDEVVVHARTPLDRLEARCDPENGSVEVSREQGSRFVVRITPRTTLPPGEFQYSCNLTGVRPDGRRLPPVPLRVQGVVEPDVAAAPPTVTFGNLSPGERRSFVFKLYSRSDLPFHVVSSAVQGEGLECIQIAQERTRSVHEYQISLAPSETGGFQGAVKFTVSMGATATVDIAVPVIGHVFDDAVPTEDIQTIQKLDSN